MAEITATVLAEFAATLLLHDRPPTVNKILRHLMALLRFAGREGLTAAVPDWHRIREDRKTPLAFTLDEFGRRKSR